MSKTSKTKLASTLRGKKAGRGAYIFLDVAIAKLAKKKRTFDKAFGLKIADEFYDELIAYVDHQVERAKLFGNEK